MTFKNMRNAPTLPRFGSPTSSLTTLLMVNPPHPPGLLDLLAEREIGSVEVPPCVCPGGVTFMFPDEQLHRNRSASQGQVGVVDSRLSHWEVSLHLLEGPLGRLDPELGWT